MITRRFGLIVCSLNHPILVAAIAPQENEKAVTAKKKPLEERAQVNAFSVFFAVRRLHTAHAHRGRYVSGHLFNYSICLAIDQAAIRPSIGPLTTWKRLGITGICP